MAALAERIHDPAADDATRQAAIRAVAGMDHFDAAATLRGALSHPSADVVSAAARALGRREDTESSAALARLLAHDDASVRLAGNA